MEEKKKSLGASIGYLFLSFVPVSIFILIQLLASVVVMGLIAVVYVLQIKSGAITVEPGMIPDFIMNSLMDVYMEHVMTVSLISQVISFVVFGLWYYLVWGKKNKRNPLKVFTGKDITGIIIIGISLEIAISSMLNIAGIFFPKIMEEYQNMLETAGLDEVSVIVVLATILMAPLVEEIVFRGITLKFAMKVSKSFWIANIIQALAFGIGHMNLVQGCYAFVLGIVMGCMYKKYHTIYATILLHAVFNFFGTIVTSLLSMIPFMNTILASVIEIILFTGIGVWSYKRMK